jgi:plastocyanin
MKRLALILSLAGLAAGCGGTTHSAPVPAADGAQAASLVISHETRGCHAWSLNGSTFAAGQVATLMHGNGVTVTNNDVMPHQLVQLSGPSTLTTGLAMNSSGAKATLVFPTRGTYVFKTIAGEDYPSAAGITTVGADAVLRLTVHVI